MFPAALLATAKLWKEPKCPWTDEWIKMWCMYTMDYHSMKKNKILPFAATWMEPECIMLSKISQRTTYDFTHMWNVKNTTNEHRGREGKIK